MEFSWFKYQTLALLTEFLLVFLNRYFFISYCPLGPFPGTVKWLFIYSRFFFFKPRLENTSNSQRSLICESLRPFLLLLLPSHLAVWGIAMPGRLA